MFFASATPFCILSMCIPPFARKLRCQNTSNPLTKNLTSHRGGYFKQRQRGIQTMSGWLCWVCCVAMPQQDLQTALSLSLSHQVKATVIKVKSQFKAFEIRWGLIHSLSWLGSWGKKKNIAISLLGPQKYCLSEILPALQKSKHILKKKWVKQVFYRPGQQTFLFLVYFTTFYLILFTIDFRVLFD